MRLIAKYASLFSIFAFNKDIKLFLFYNTKIFPIKRRNVEHKNCLAYFLDLTKT